MDARFDDLLNTVITEKGQGIYGFFDVMFSFLYRRTDFFYEMAPGENMGFFPSQAEAIVCGYFRKYQQLHYKERVPKRNIDPKVIEEYMKNKGKENKEKKEVIDKINNQAKMGIEINEQGKKLDSIENNIDETEENTKKAYKEALETEIIMNKSKKKLYCMAFLM